MKLTSSRFAAAMGVSPWQSRQKLWRLLTGRENPEPMNANMEWGIQNEFRAVAAVEAITGLLFNNTGKRQIHYPLIAHGVVHDCTPVSFVFGTTPDGNCGSTGLEVKCPQQLTDEPPLHYIPQLMGQMWIASFATVIFGQWTPNESRAWVVYRDDEYIEQMCELLADFSAYIDSDTVPKRRKKPVLPLPLIERINPHEL